MASSSTNPPAAPDPFDLGIHTPANLNRGARAILLRDSPAQPISIIESANELARERVEEYNAKLMVFQAFCAKFEEAAQQFTNGPQRRFAQQFADSFLDSWKRELSGDMPTSKPTYSSVAASHPSDRARPAQQHQQQRRRSDPPHRQGQQTTVAHPDKTSASSSEKLGTVSDKIRQVFQVRSGWAILTADSETRDFLVEKQAEWAAKLGATAVETNKEWHTYVVSDFPRRLTDFRGNKVDSNSVISDEIEIQTGLKPVDIRTGRQLSDNPLTKTLLVSFLKPTKKRFWSLFGSRAARLIDKTDVPKQYSQTRKNDKKPLKVFQANVGKIPPAHDCALALADTERYDIVLLQEPWTAHAKDRCLTKTHPAYDAFTPVDMWNSNDTRPRVMTYVRRDSRLLADQIRPFETRDILWITVNGMTIVNFYRQNDESDALNTLLRWPVPERCLVAGDFNARHHTWQTGQATNRGQEIADWASEHELSLLNTLDIPTNPHGNTIDLAFTNMPLAEATVEDHLATSSDHFTLSLTFPDIKLAPSQPGKIRVTTEDELKRFVEIVELGAAEIPRADSTPEELDELASSLASLLTSAAKAAGRHGKADAQPPGGQRSAPPRRLVSEPSDDSTLSASTRMFRSLKETFTVWSAGPRDSIGGTSSTASPVNNVVYETQMDKANALRQATLERRTAEDDIANAWTPVSPSRLIPFSSEISLDEAQYATIHTGNTSPGSDNITVNLLKAVWHIIGTHIRRLFEGCLSVGHHPKSFKEAEVVMIAKPGRRDLTEPGAWRPISLLSCLGKGLERLIARRLAWAAVYYSVLHTQQAGALSKRSATDLVTALIHDIEEAFARKKVATLVTMDVQGAFDTVMCNRLVLRLREQGWPDHLARWAGSFISGRSIAEMVRWGAANGVSFDTKKTEVMHFSRSKLRTAPSVRHGDAVKHPESTLRWLGIWLDSRLSFRLHVEKWAAKAKAVAYHLRGLTNTIHGPLPSAVRSAVRACVEPVLLHGSEAWTRLRRADELLAPCPRPKLVQRRFQQEELVPLQAASKEKTASTFPRWLQSLDPLTLVVYSDGSLSSEGAASYGFTIHQNNIPISDGSGRLGPAEVFDAEAAGALEGLKAALNLRDAATQNIFICLDNLAAATCLRGTPSDSSQDVFLEFQALATSHGAVQVRWVPGHCDIPGNEQADKLAKVASLLPEPEGARPTLAYIRRIARQKPKEAFEAWWSTSAPEQYKRLNLKATTGCPPELSLPRAALHHLLAARSLHGDFAAYHERFDHIDARLVCSYGRHKAPDHIFYCRKVPPRHRMRMAPSPNAAVNLAVGQDFTKFIDLYKKSAFFGKICPRY
ncbi:hypothetical protein ACKAV7_014083 [Fusarium commune]